MFRKLRCRLGLHGPVLEISYKQLLLTANGRERCDSCKRERDVVYGMGERFSWPWEDPS